MALGTNKPAAKFSGATMIAAAFSMLATPAAAADLPSPAHAKAYDASAETVERHRRWRHHDDVDVGDVLAGVLILGGIAAIASAAGERDREDRYPDYDRAPRYRAPEDPGYDEGRGMGRAVDMCVAEVERDFGRVDTVNGANRTGDGWQVSGELADGRIWSCWIGNDGQVSGVDVTEGYSSSSADAPDGQWSDEAYARARAEQGEYPPARSEDFQ